LSALAGAEKAGVGGKAVKIFNDFIQRGRTDPITEKDFSNSELNSFRKLIETKIEKTGKNAGAIHYKDYDNQAIDQNIIGQFTFKKNSDGSIDIKDTYDFNPKALTTPGNNNELVQMLSAFVAPQRLGQVIGAKVLPDGKGIPVHIRIPNHRSEPKK
jgi:hypothetical protein